MDQQPTWIGRTLSGRYKIEAMLGQGGMSAVYKATDPNLKRVVAIKLIHPHLSTDPSFVQRFESEASAVASLRHPNIVQVYDFNNDNGLYYMVLEFIVGETLQERMKRLSETSRQLAVEDVIRFTSQISDAVGYAHQRGMVHRDIKPANIMLDVQGQAILMDFGIVKILGGDVHTSTGAVVGTARYMSPEIIRGEVADHRADIYSLGVTMYEMLSGRPPFVADSAMTLMMMHLHDPIPNVRSFRADISAEMVRIFERCLAKDRNNRYQSAAELSADLRRALTSTGQQTSVSAPEVPQFQTIVSKPDPAVAPVTPPGFQPYPSAPNTSFTNSSVNKPASSRRSLWMLGAGLAVIACIAAALIVGRLVLSGLDSAPPQPTQTMAIATDTSAPTDEPLAIALATETLAPTEMPTEAPTTTATLPPLYVRINSITVNDSGNYVVDYETFGYTEVLPGMHVHFFFNTVPLEQAGSPGSGPWYLYGGPRPFTKYREIDRPGDATEMCALVANNNHSVVAESGNCVNLP
ncbi:MAG: protein kinase [Chloroflexota bacterium]